MTYGAKQRQALFLAMAAKDGGATAQAVFEAGQAEGDEVSQEAYFNLGRRLVHRGLLKPDRSGDRTIYFNKADKDATWLEEDRLVALVDPDYPLLGLTVYRESQRQARDIPKAVWLEARERLCQVDARQLFADAIVAYADHFCDEVENYASERARLEKNPDLPELRRQAEATLLLLDGLCKNGLGLSKEAISLPASVNTCAEAMLKHGRKALYVREQLEDELSRRIESGPFLREALETGPDMELRTAGVDGSAVGGLLSLPEVYGDFTFGQAPQVSVNTAAGVLDMDIRIDGEEFPAALRFPEKPEDMQQRDNKYTIMAKMFYPDLTDSEYVHSTWNAMDLVECRATLSLMNRWNLSTGTGDVEVPPTDVIFRDGTLVPNDRDPSHYGQQSTYGRIVRYLIEASWKIARNCKDSGQTVLGVVKNAQLRVLAPVVNYHLSRVADKHDGTQIRHWPLGEMNAMFDQSLMTRLLTVERGAQDPWLRTALVLRPFHATSNLGKFYSRATGFTPYDKLIERSRKAREKALEEITPEDDWWRTELRVPGDPYLQMLQNVSYASFYLGTSKDVDRSEHLPRMEFLAVGPTEESGAFPQALVCEHLGRCLAALRKVGFDVAKEHAMYGNAGQIDLMPSTLLRAHNLVKHWAKELRDRVSEYMDWQLAKHLSTVQKRAVRMRPWQREVLESWLNTMQAERRRKDANTSKIVNNSTRSNGQEA